MSVEFVEATSFQRHKCISLEYKQQARTIGRVKAVQYIVAQQSATDPWRAMSLSVNRRN